MFNGSIETFDREGNLIGALIIQNGDVVTIDGTTTPCSEPLITDSSSTGGGGGSNDSQTDSNGSGVFGGSSSSGITGIYDDSFPCGLSYSYGACDGGVEGQHGPATNSSLPSNMCSGSTIIVTDCNGTILGQGRSNTITNTANNSGCSGSVGFLIPEDTCTTSTATLNAIYSANSPFNVDLSNVRAQCDDTIDLSQVEANAKFMCVYNKLANSPKFKDLIIDTFGESENLNVKFEIHDNLAPVPPSTTSPLGTSKIDSAYVNSTNGTLTKYWGTIKINKSLMNSNSSLALAKTIMHEMIHSFLDIKMHGCNQGSQLNDFNDVELSEILNQYYQTSCPNQSDHEFMFDELLPTMSNILKSVKDDLIRSDIQYFVEDGYTFIDEDIPGNPELPWNWDQFYEYYCMAGLHKTNAFINNIQNDSDKYSNWNTYVNAGNNLFTFYCED